MNNSKLRSTIIILGLIFLISLSACGNQRIGADIVDISWQWTSLSEKEPASQSVVPNPENYTITFSGDGSISIQADCNVVNGSFSGEGTALTFTLGPSTLAFCGEESLDLMFTELLSTVESYSIKNDLLILYLEDDFGSMTFNR